MKYLIDLSSSQPQGSAKKNGGGEYSITVCKEVNKALSDDDQLSVIFNSELAENTEAIQYCKGSDITILYYDSVSTFNEIIEKGQFDCIVLPVCYYKYSDLRINDSVRLITVIHDLCDVHFNEKKVRYGRYIKKDGLNWLRKIRNRVVGEKKKKQLIEAHNRAIHLNNNQTIITVSNYSADAFHRYLDIKPNDKIRVFYPPEIRSSIILEDDNKEQAVLDKYGLNKGKYFMLSAGARWTKNNAIALFALDELFGNLSNKDFLEGYKAIIIGTDQRHKEYYESKIKNLDRFVIDDYVDDYTIEALYKHAHLYMFPSVLEGFGLPPIEAMKYGSISACSDEMSIPEVCGDAVIYFNPYNKESIKDAVLKSFNDQYIGELKKKGLTRFTDLKKRRETDFASLIELIVGQGL